MKNFMSKRYEKKCFDTFSAPCGIRTGHCAGSLKLLALHKCNNCLKNVSKP